MMVTIEHVCNACGVETTVSDLEPATAELMLEVLRKSHIHPWHMVAAWQDEETKRLANGARVAAENSRDDDDAEEETPRTQLGSPEERDRLRGMFFRDCPGVISVSDAVIAEWVREQQHRGETHRSAGAPGESANE